MTFDIFQIKSNSCETYPAVSKGTIYSLFTLLRGLALGLPAQLNLKVAHKLCMYAALQLKVWLKTNLAGPS